MLYFVFGDEVEATLLLLCKQLKPFDDLLNRFGMLLRGWYFYNDGLHVPFAHISFVPVDDDTQLVVRPGFIVTVYLPIKQDVVP